MLPRLTVAFAYVASIVLANWLTVTFGFVPVGPGLTAIAGTYAAGLAFIARDAVHDVAGRGAVLALLAVGALLSWWLSTPALALASAVAFAVSELADMVVYAPLRRRGYVRAAVASNSVGSVIDTALFLWLAGFGLAPLVVAGQLVGKAWVTVAVIGVVAFVRVRRRAVSA